MIILRLRGGLGNQLFMYAAARRLAVQNGVPLKLDSVSGFKWDANYNRKYLLHNFNIFCDPASAYESCVGPFGRARRNLMRRINRYIAYEKRFYIYEDAGRFDPRFLNRKIDSKIYLEGYWQSEDYFKDIESTIKNDLKIVSDMDRDTKAEADIIRGRNSVCIGIRLFREEEGINDRHILKLDYYKKAVDRIVKMVKEPFFVIVTEEPDLIKERLPLPYEHYFVVHKPMNEDAYKNLWLMSLCRHFIVSQGTYHWWGAWLSNDPDKIVIAPEPQGLGLEANFFPKEWIKIPN